MTTIPDPGPDAPPDPEPVIPDPNPNPDPAPIIPDPNPNPDPALALRPRRTRHDTR
ncbi:MAG TPA: hypothetical protein VD926_12930 [Acidimicrobiales bacterium]|nr:hypothetical protein [Acidimicrobiales bacterium]